MAFVSKKLRITGLVIAGLGLFTLVSVIFISPTANPEPEPLITRLGSSVTGIIASLIYIVIGTLIFTGKIRRTTGPGETRITKRLICRSCGTRVLVGDSFCQNCGEKLGSLRSGL